ncbi:MAG: hypothetical protein HC865_14375 [Cyanobacteria bacterium RU_5_0]|nr:hypothetical protein [Cyanobacteria bacterium RU_5_0]
MLTSLKRLLSSIVDYAGLFPPAQIGLPESMTIYDRAHSSPHGWMLDRFVLPAFRLHEWISLLPTFHRAMYLSKPWSLSVILSKNWATELEQIHQIRETALQRDYQIGINALEVVPLSPAEIQQVCLNLPAEVDTFFEIPFDADLEPYLEILQQTGAAAKLRTGGITRDAFPDSIQLSQHILSLAKAQIPFKATAGLHHALRGNYRLTYQPESDSTIMHGFLNVAILAAFAYQQSLILDEALAILEEPSIAQFQFSPTEVSWRDRSLSIPEIELSRQQFFRSFGSCSFQEPIDDLHTLGFLWSAPLMPLTI